MCISWTRKGLSTLGSLCKNRPNLDSVWRHVSVILVSEFAFEDTSNTSLFYHSEKIYGFMLLLISLSIMWLIHVGTYLYIRGGADKSLARPTSRCRRTESIVSLEREVYSCAELQVFSCYRGWKEACQATRAISTTSRRQLSSRFFFPARQGTEGNSRHSDRNIRGTCTIVCHRQKLGGPV